MTQCPKCGKETIVKVTTQNKKKVKEKKGLLHLVFWIITFPFYGLWRLIFGKRKVNYVKETKWNCRYCGHTWKDKGDEE